MITFTPQPKQLEFLRSSADICIYGGAAGGGKTFVLLYEPLHDIKNRDFRAVIFRRNYTEINESGGMWDESYDLYSSAGASPSPGNMEWTFPSGAAVSFRHMQTEDDRMKYKGSQIPLIGFDQLESFTEKQFFYMLSRNRSVSGAQCRIRATANAQPGWLADFLEWWIDQKTGYAIPSRSGAIRWMVRSGDGIRWADTRQELVRKFKGCLPISVQFILAKLSDKLSLPPVKYVVKIEVESVWDMGPGPKAGQEIA